MNKETVLSRELKDIELIESTKPAELCCENKSLPTIAHCLGKSRLLGQFYAAAIVELLQLKPEIHVEIFHELCILLRTYVVIDDFLRDRASTEAAQKASLAKWLANLKLQIEGRLKIFNFAELNFEQYLADIDSAYEQADGLSDMQLVAEKCKLVFLPLSKEFFTSSEKSVTDVRKTIGEYLFLLQLVDDFADIEEDALSSINHNTFSRKIEPDKVNTVIHSREILVLPLLQHVETRCADLENNISNGILVFNCVS
jgi:hypothetical protein